MKKQILLFIFFFLIVVNLTYSYNPEHLRIFSKQDNLKSWHQWRKRNPSVKPDLSYAILKKGGFNFDFSYVNFQHAQITQYIHGKSNFEGADFSYSTIKEFRSISTSPPMIASYKRTNFFKTKIIDSFFYAAVVSNVNFTEAEIQNTKFQSSNFKYAAFVKTKILNSELGDNLLNVNFSFATIADTKIVSFPFLNSKMINSKFDHVKISNSTIAGAIINTSFINADLNNVSFYYSYIPEGSVLTNVNFTNANLTNVNFQKAKFQNVIFKNADMTGAKLERKWFDYVKKQGVRNFDKIQWM